MLYPFSLKYLSFYYWLVYYIIDDFYVHFTRNAVYSFEFAQSYFRPILVR